MIDRLPIFKFAYWVKQKERRASYLARLFFSDYAVAV
jgi:hypothetical protein